MNYPDITGVASLIISSIFIDCPNEDELRIMNVLGVIENEDYPVITEVYIVRILPEA